MRRYDHVDLRVRNLAEARVFYETLLPALGFDRDARIEGWLQFERGDRGEIAEFFGVTESPLHVANECRIAFWASSVGEVDDLARVVVEAGGGTLKDARLRRLSITPCFLKLRPEIALRFFTEPDPTSRAGPRCLRNQTYG